MALGRDLYSSSAGTWPPAGPCLLLNPRLEPSFARRVLSEEFPDHSECLWLATSGTQRASGFKLVALSRAALEASARRVNALLGVSRGDLWINPLPIFHVGGFSIVVRTSLAGCRMSDLPAWSAASFAEEARRLSATLASLVPAQLHDLVAAGIRSPGSLRAVVLGGGALEDSLRERALQLGWPVLRSYGLTEAASQVATESHPGERAGWLPLLDHCEARTDGEGLLELRGPSLLTGWLVFGDSGPVCWEDPKRDGWFRTNDRVELRGRELRVLGRVDDLVKIRGELVDVGMIERTLQARVDAGRVAVLAGPDARNGAVLRIVAENPAAADAARALRDEVFPPYARPGEIVVGPIEVTASGKTVRRPGP